MAKSKNGLKISAPKKRDRLYTFVRMSCCMGKSKPSVWCLKVPEDDVGLIENVHRSVSTSLFLRIGKDPHLFTEDGIPKEAISLLVDPKKLVAGWGETFETYLQENGFVLVNESGGIFPAGKKEKPVQEVIQDKLIWPESFNKREHEIITVSRWGNGKHYYLHSSKGRIFIPEKHRTRKSAVEHASEFVDEDKIRFKVGGK